MHSKETQVNVLEIPKSTGYWLLRADGGKYYEDFFLNNFIAVSDNEITLEKIKDYDDNSLAGITTEDFKDLYKEIYNSWSPQQIAHAASRTEKFCNEMKPNDLVLFPSKRSTNFLLGAINSDVYENIKEDTNHSKEVHYSVCPYNKRRKVTWIKEIERGDISEKLYWLLSAHQTIFNLYEQKEFINQLLSPVYIQNGVCHGTIKVSKEDDISSEEWYTLHSIINKYTNLEQDKIFIKTNVQSPGIIEFISSNSTVIFTIITTLSAVTFGEVSTEKIKFIGILRYAHQRKKEKKELQMMDQDVIAKEIKNEKDKIEIEKRKIELEKLKHNWEKEKEKEAEVKIRKDLQLSSFDAGRIVGDEKQMDNVENLDSDKL